MSKLTSWQEFGEWAMRKIRRRMARQVLAGFRVGEARALPPTQGACRAQRELETWRRCYAQESSFLHEERRNFCEAFIFNASAAARLIDAHSPSDSLAELWKPLVLLLNGLKYLVVIQDFDHLDPEQGRGGAWHDIKMGLTQTCLGLLLRILWAVLPRRADTWEEWHVGLHGHDWKQQFIIDSPVWRERLMIPPTEFPGLCQSFREARERRWVPADEGTSDPGVAITRVVVEDGLDKSVVDSESPEMEEGFIVRDPLCVWRGA